MEIHLCCTAFRGFRFMTRREIFLTELELPDATQIYDQQFIREEKDSWLEVTWYDGTVRCYSANDGTLISEEKKEAPQKDLYEEFFTQKYRIASSLHGAPEVYDLKSGQKVKKSCRGGLSGVCDTDRVLYYHRICGNDTGAVRYLIG